MDEEIELIEELILSYSRERNCIDRKFSEEARLKWNEMNKQVDLLTNIKKFLEETT